jgi:hypothetical protein
MTIKDYLSVISGSLAFIIALIIILTSFKTKYRSRILTLRLTAFILFVLGSLSLIEIVN